MPFTNKYSHMGQTERIRIPKVCIKHIENILEECNRLYGTHEQDYVDNILESIANKLNGIE